MEPVTPYSDEEVAALYDLLNPWGPSDNFYLALVMAARSVLEATTEDDAADVDAAADGPAEVDAGAGDRIGSEGDGAEFEQLDRALMTGHAFQVLVTDEDVRESLAAIRRALVDGGRFAFETRNPLARAWERWNPENAVEVVDPSGRKVRIWHEVEAVAGDVVTFTETTGGEDGTPLRVDRATLRFLEVDALRAFLAEAGFLVEAQYGGWFREPLDRASPEIVTIARTKPR